VVRKVVPLTRDLVERLPTPCRACTLWEIGSQPNGPATKGEWVSAVLLDWGSCGRVVLVDDEVAGFAIYAPPAYAEGAHALVGATQSQDCVLLLTARVLPQFQGGGLGRMLFQSMAKDLIGRRRIRAIEVFGDALGRENNCVVPAAFLTAVGFTTVQAHPRYPRLRLDLRGVLSWRDDVELALERWLGAIKPTAIRPGTIHPDDAATASSVSTRQDPTSRCT
jgi:GNAT superfamily N-acetyltransferase